MERFVAPLPVVGELMSDHYLRLIQSIEDHINRVTGIAEASQHEAGEEWR